MQFRGNTSKIVVAMEEAKAAVVIDGRKVSFLSPSLVLSLSLSSPAPSLL